MQPRLDSCREPTKAPRSQYVWPRALINQQLSREGRVPPEVVIANTESIRCPGQRKLGEKRHGDRWSANPPRECGPGAS
ncbi:hypothetical protein IMZ48_29275 [Candidatus Bathyarchaeota archaeon]|nr:hypothetical protein [Candidatus Bathyarchaeota archaeon]